MIVGFLDMLTRITLQLSVHNVILHAGDYLATETNRELCWVGYMCRELCWVGYMLAQLEGISDGALWHPWINFLVVVGLTIN